MFLRYFVLFLWLVAAFAAPAAQLRLKRLQVGSKIYRGVTILGANTTDVYFTHDEGIANVRLKYLSEDLQKRFSYDAQAATEAERQQAEDDARYQASLAAAIAAKAQKAARDAEKAALSSALSLADPISDKSLLGKTAPALKVDLWVGEKPSLEGRFVLTYFWAPWSIPSRKYIHELNEFQKKFPEKLTVVGVTTEPKEEVEAMTEPKIEFSSALDTSAKAITAAGVTSIPQVMLADPKGIVLYYGHPAALTSTNLAALLADRTE